MKLLTQSLKKNLPPLGSSREEKDPLVYAVFTNEHDETLCIMDGGPGDDGDYRFTAWDFSIDAFAEFSLSKLIEQGYRAYRATPRQRLSVWRDWVKSNDDYDDHKGIEVSVVEHDGKSCIDVVFHKLRTTVTFSSCNARWLATRLAAAADHIREQHEGCPHCESKKVSGEEKDLIELNRMFNMDANTTNGQSRNRLTEGQDE